MIAFKHKQFSFFRPNCNTKLRYMRSALTDLFLDHSKNAKAITDGK